MIAEIIKINDIVYPKDKTKFKSGKYKMFDLVMFYNNGYFKIQNHSDIYNKYADNKSCLWDIKRITRKMESLAKYWLIMNALSYHFPESEIDGKIYNLTKDDYHAIMKKKFLHTETINSSFGSYEKLSISFEKIDETEFRVYLNNVVNYITELGYDVEDLINNN